jgi:chaperonin GroEL
MKEKKARVEDALHATRAAVEEGILPGGGVALLRASSKLKPDGLNHDQQVGYKIVTRACRSPISAIAANAGQDGGIVAEKVAAAKGNEGYNAATDEYEDLATLLLTSDALIAEAPKKDKKGGGAAAPGMDDMY